MKQFSKGICAGWLSLMFAATPALAQEAIDDEPGEAAVETSAEAEAEEAAEEASEEESEGKNWSAGFSLGSSIGQGTFVDVDSDLSDPGCTLEDQLETGCIAEGTNAFDRANLSYSLSGSYQLADFSFSSSIALVQWLTAGGGRNDAYEVRWQDLGLEAGYKGYTFESIGVNIAPSLGLTFPTSQISRFTSLVLGTSLGVGISKTFFDKLNLSLGLSGGKDFHRFTSPVFDAEKFESEEELRDGLNPESVVYRSGGSEDLGRGLVAVDGLNTEWSFSGSLSASIPVWDKLRLSAFYALSTFWSYAINADDEMTPDIEGINTGRGVAQVTRTGLTLSYPVTVADKLNLGFSAGLSTGQFPKTSDNKSFRFPFWNFQGAASNASALKFGVSASY
jgi:hypothetical protein